MDSQETPLFTPVINLTDSETVVVQEIKNACSSAGFFYVSHHDVDEELISEAFQHVKALLTLPMRDKMMLLADRNQRGYVPLYEQCLDPASQISGDTKEGFYIGPEVLPDSPDANLPLHGPNRWPDEVLLPNFKATMNKYVDAMGVLGNRLIRLLALALDLPHDFFSSYFENPFYILRPVRYTEEISIVDHGIFAAGAHVDWGMLSIVAMNAVPGLQGFIDGRWQDIPYKPNTLCIIVGEILERWTNGIFKALLHRVVNTTGQERYAIPYFLKPSFGAEVSCLPHCCKDKPPQYPPSTCGHLILDRYDETHFGFQKPMYDSGVKTMREMYLGSHPPYRGPP